MDRQVEATRLLKQARDALAKRLAQRVIAEQEDLLEDAEGQSFMDEINVLYRQIGRRLHQVNTMIDDLAAAGADSCARPPVLALPAPRSGRESRHLAPVSLQTMAAHLHAGKHEDAARFLATAFGLDLEQGARCASHFAAAVSRRPELLLKTMQLRNAVQDCRYNDALAMLHDCFGLKTLESLHVLRHLAHRYGRDDSAEAK